MMRFPVGPAFRALLIPLAGLLVTVGGTPSSAFGADPATPTGKTEATALSDEALTGQRFEAGMAALQAARAASDRATRDGKLDEAIAAFRAILVNQPELVRVRLELAYAFFLKEEDRRAKRHFEQVLAGDLPPAVVANLRRFLQVMRQRRRWEAWFGAAIAPDSNLNAASGERTIFLDTDFGRLPFTLDDPAKPESGLGLSLWGGGEYQHPLTDHRRLRIGANASLREYRGREFDRQSLALHLGPRWLIDARSEASLLATVDRQWTAGRPETDRFGLRLEADRRLTPRLSISAQTSAARRNCRGCGHLDGPEGEISLGASWIARPTLRLGGNVGWNWSRAKVEHWRSRGPQVSLGATLALPKGFTLGLRTALERTDYQGSGAAHHTIDRKSRRDETRTFTFSVHNRALTLRGFSPRLSLIREERHTNAQALDFERNRAELSFVRPL